MLFATVFAVASCEKEESITVIDDPQASLHCVKPNYLKEGDRVALISPSYFTPMENVEKTADVTALATPMIVQPSEIPQE